MVDHDMIILFIKQYFLSSNYLPQSAIEIHSLLLAIFLRILSGIHSQVHIPMEIKK